MTIIITQYPSQIFGKKDVNGNCKKEAYSKGKLLGKSNSYLIFASTFSNFE
jgi:hypothetical protein